MDIIFGLALLTIAYIIFIIEKKPIQLRPALPPCAHNPDCVPTKRCVTAPNLTKMCVNPSLMKAIRIMLNGSNQTPTDCHIRGQSTVVSPGCLINAFHRLNRDIVVPIFGPLMDILNMYETQHPLPNTTTSGLLALVPNWTIPSIEPSKQMTKDIHSAYKKIASITAFDGFLIINAGYSVFPALQTSYTALFNDFNSWAALVASTVPGYPGVDGGSDFAQSTYDLNIGISQVMTDFAVINKLLPLVINQAATVIKFAE